MRITISALRGAGKSTVAHFIRKALEEHNCPVEMVNVDPNYADLDTIDLSSNKVSIHEDRFSNIAIDQSRRDAAVLVNTFLPSEERPNAQDYANRDERDAAWLDEWRLEQACHGGCGSGAMRDARSALTEYRRLVREDVRPAVEPAEDHADVLDAKTVIRAYCDLAQMDPVGAAAVAFRTIKERVQRETIWGLPDDPTEALQSCSAIGLNSTYVREIMGAIKRVYG